MNTKKLLALAALMTIPAISDAGICNNASLKGNYAAVYREGEFQGFGSFTFDGTTDAAGMGKVTFIGFENGRLDAKNPVTGTGGVYTFNSSCTLSLAITWHPYPFPETVFLANSIAVASQLTNAANTAATATTPIVYGINIPARLDGFIFGKWTEKVGTSTLSHTMKSTIELTRKYK